MLAKSCKFTFSFGFDFTLIFIMLPFQSEEVMLLSLKYWIKWFQNIIRFIAGQITFALFFSSASSQSHLSNYSRHFDK